MAQDFLDLQTLKFILYHVHDVSGILELPRYQDYDLTSVDLYLDAVSELAEKELFPCFREMDAHPAHYQDGEIIVHKKVPEFIRKAEEMGMLSAWMDAEEGGMQMPASVVTASYYIVETANNHIQGYIGLIQGAAELLLSFGNETLKTTYVPKMTGGSWGGTMCLTEPQAGSSLSDITTAATPNGDYYNISGQKIFISGGDYQGVENIVHLVLARIKGAPAGTRGISLFAVPKNRLTADGGLEPNDVTTVGDFQKMGQRGFCTAHLSFGDSGDCRGWLVGEANKGLAYMFQMMNGARIGVGRGAAAITMAAYQASLAYAHERPQGRSLSRDGTKDPSQEQTLIINHPDVKRMLLLQKTVAEGSLSLVLLASKYQDLSLAHPDEAERRKFHLLLEVLTPIAKSYPAEMGVISVSNGLQVLGGYGFCSDFILEQYYRDIRIYPIYEGTTGIQAQDLLGRKLTMENGRAWKLLSGEIAEGIAGAKGIEGLVPCADQLEVVLAEANTVLSHLLAIAGTGDYERFLSDATVFMEYFGKIVLGWLWLDMASMASQVDEAQYTQAFFQSKVRAMEFYFNYELPRTRGLLEILKNDLGVTLRPPRELFP